MIVVCLGGIGVGWEGVREGLKVMLWRVVMYVVRGLISFVVL